MFALLTSFFCVAANQGFFTDFVTNVQFFDFSTCSAYSAEHSCFVSNANPDFAVYLPKNYSFKDDQLDSCFVITNGIGGRRHFFESLFKHCCEGQHFYANGWKMARADNKGTRSFIGILSQDLKTFAAIGNYDELFATLPQRKEYKPCLAGESYYSQMSSRELLSQYQASHYTSAADYIFNTPRIQQPNIGDDLSRQSVFQSLKK